MKQYEDFNDALAEGWKSATIADVCERITDGTHKTPKYVEDGIPFISTANLVPFRRGFDFSTYRRFISVEEHNDLIKRCSPEKGDLLLSKCGTIGRAKEVDVDFPFSMFVGLALLKFSKGVFSEGFLEYLFNWQGITEELEALAPGSTRKTLTLTAIKKLRIPIPPLAEQKRIVSKIEELLPRVNAVRERLIRVKEIMKRFRQSVLAAACSGRLTEEWRDNAQSIESSRELIKRVLGRRKKEYDAEWGTARRKRRRDAPKPNYYEFREVKIDELPEIPEDWDWAYLPFLGYMNRGKSQHRPRNAPHLYGGPYPFIQTGDIAQSGGKITSHRQTYNEEGLKQSRIWPQGTVSITIAANIAHSGILSYPACFPDSVVGVIPDSDLCRGEFLEYFIRTARSNLDEFAPATSQKNINIAILSDLAVPLPPLVEQTEIVRRVEVLFKLADKIEKRVEVELSRTEKMTQAVLAKAFRGELVPTEAKFSSS